MILLPPEPAHGRNGDGRDEKYGLRIADAKGREPRNFLEERSADLGEGYLRLVAGRIRDAVLLDAHRGARERILQSVNVLV